MKIIIEHLMSASRKIIRECPLQLVFCLSLILPGQTTAAIRIPFRYVQNFIVLDLKLEHVLPLKMIFDTGAEHHLLFDKKHTDLISNAYLREVRVMGSDLQQEIPALLTTSLDLGLTDRQHRNAQFVVLLEQIGSVSEMLGEQIDGILSASIFADNVFEINYKHHYIQIYEGLPSPKKLLGFGRCSLQIYKNKPFVNSNLTIARGTDPVALNLLIDTGAGISVLLYKSTQSTLSLPDSLIPGKLGSGLGGLLNGFLARTEKLDFCNTSFDKVITSFQEINTEYSERESRFKQGLIGNQVLEKYTLMLDYMHSTLYWKQSTPDRTIRTDRSGMTLVAGGYEFNQFTVAHILPGSPADRMGITTGDRILSVNRWPAGWLNLRQIQRRLSRTGDQKVRLRISHEGHKKTLVLSLKDVI
ncbi:MAG: PDZ domain-containing protein [Saprospiraceae bacterium]|nr:PDZ domain-containing protein [Saprospiraceae bacterium]HMW40065.1 PDZ domain-containing protein [Saprospiraceae bacterium]HMX88933.1 PDZ domain-containing protein [Saprospiraceae bacterium]HMZ40140.1 PDZ domain-containing protein [Saprospiraceae bacterium]HNA64455.1 PDZ domain-containing protein [Saprospiraceae bacterium]